MPSVGVIGVGSIGTVLAKGFNRLNHDVFVYDIDESKTDRLDIPTKDPGWISRRCDFSVFAVPTPSTENGGDYTHVDQALHPFRETDSIVVLRSTMPPGSTGFLNWKYDIPIVYSPEFLRDRSGVEDFFHPDRIVIAGEEEYRKPVRSLFEAEEIQCDTFIETDDYLTAELGKYAHNAFFATKVSFANQMRTIAESEGADPEAVMQIVTEDSRNTDSHLDPMLGPFGGKCLPKDLKALIEYARTEQVPIPVLAGVRNMNEMAKDEYDNIEIEGNWPNITTASD